MTQQSDVRREDYLADQDRPRAILVCLADVPRRRRTSLAEPAGAGGSGRPLAGPDHQHQR